MIDETKIMQYADGTLPQEEHEEVKKLLKLILNLKNCITLIKKLETYYLN